MSLASANVKRSPKTLAALSVLREIGFLKAQERTDSTVARDEASSICARRDPNLNEIIYLPLQGIRQNIEINVKASSGDKKRTFIVNPDINLKSLKENCDRANIILPTIDSETLKVARDISATLQGKIFKDFTSFKQEFQKEFKTKYNALTNIDINAASYISCLLVTRSQTRPEAEGKKFPQGFLELDDAFPEKVKTLVRFILAEEHACKTARDLEGSNGSLTPKLIQSGLATFAKTATVFDLLNMAYPGYLDGDYPYIRAHMLECGGKWDTDANNLASYFMVLSARRIFLEQEGLIKDGHYDRKKILSTDWGKVFNSSPLRSAYNKKLDNLTGPLDSLELAVPTIVGIEEGKIKPWEFKQLIQWSKLDSLGRASIAEKYIKLLTKCVVQQARCLKASGGLDVAKIKRERFWRNKFEEEYNGAIHNSGFSVWEAFKLTYPDSCGSRKEQLNESDFMAEAKWSNKAGVEKFKIKFAKVLYELLQCLKQTGCIITNGAIFNPEKEFKTLIVPEEAYKYLNTKQAININDFPQEGLKDLVFFVVPYDEVNALQGNASLCFGAGELSKLGIKAKKNTVEKLSNLKLIGFKSVDIEENPQLRLNGLTLADFANPLSMQPLRIGAKEIKDIKNFLLSKRILLDVILSSSGLAVPMKSIARSSVHKAFEVLLGAVNPQTGCYGNTDIDPDMVTNNNTITGESRMESTKLLKDFKKDDWVQWMKESYPAPDRENTILVNLESHHENKAIGVRPTKLLKSCKEAISNVAKNLPALEKLLVAKSSGKYIFSEMKLGVLLRLIKDKVLDMSYLSADVITAMREYIDKLYSWRSGNKHVRDILLDSISYNKAALNKPTPIGVLNRIVENVSKLAA